MTDDFSRYRKTVPLKHKNKVEEVIEEFISKIEVKGHGIEAIRKDEDTEFSSKKFKKWLKKKGIQIKDSVLYTSEQNGLSERSVGLVCTKAHLMLLATDLLQSMWAEAILTVTYLINRSLIRSLERG
jgi:transposase InsO family protein